MAAKSWQQVALECMRRPGQPSPYFPDSYAPNEARPLGRRVSPTGDNGSSQYERAVLVMGRYLDSRAFNAANNPDFGELAYLDASALSDLAGRSWNELLMWCQVYVAEPWTAAILLTTNTRLLLWDWRMLIQSISTGLWTQIAFSNEYSGHLTTPDFRIEYPSTPAVDSRVEASGYRSVRPVYDAAGPYAGLGVPYWAFHGYTGGNQFVTASDVAQIVVSCRASLVLHNPAGPDDRGDRPFTFGLGADAYPTPRNYFYPSVGCSRHRRIAARYPDFQYVVMHTMTEAQLNAPGAVPPIFQGAFEGYDEAGGGSGVVVPPGPAPTKGRWVDVFNPSSPKGRWTDIAASVNVAPQWGATVPLTATIGVPFSFTPTLTAGSPAPTFSKASGPTWASVNASTGEITGTPTGSPTETTIVVRANNGIGGNVDLTLPLSVIAAPAVPNITTTTLPNAVVGQDYYVALDYTGTEPVEFATTSGALPAGLSRVGRVISGQATTIGGPVNFSVTPSGPGGTGTARSLSITVVAAPVVGPAWVTTTLPGGTVGSPLATTVSATGATAYSVPFFTGSGTPTINSGGLLTIPAQASPGTYSITVRATSSSGATSDRTFTFAVTSPSADPAPVRTWIGPDGGGVSWQRSR